MRAYAARPRHNPTRTSRAARHADVGMAPVDEEVTEVRARAPRLSPPSTLAAASTLGVVPSVPSTLTLTRSSPLTSPLPSPSPSSLPIPAGGVPGSAQGAPEHHLRQDPRGAQGPRRPHLGAAVRASSPVPRSPGHDPRPRRAQRHPRRRHEGQGFHLRVRRAHPPRVRHSDGSLLLPAPRRRPRAFPRRRRPRLQDDVRARILVALPRRSGQVRGPRRPRLLPFPHPPRVPHLLPGQGGVPGPRGWPGREIRRDQPRAFAGGVRRDEPRVGPRRRPRRHPGEDRAREGGHLQTPRARVHLPAARGGDGGAARARGGGWRAVGDRAAPSSVRRRRRGEDPTRTRRRASGTQRRARRAASARVGARGTPRVGPRGGGGARGGHASARVSTRIGQDGMVGTSAGGSGRRARGVRTGRGIRIGRVARGGVQPHVVPRRRAHGRVHATVRGVVLRVVDVVVVVVVRGGERQRVALAAFALAFVRAVASVAVQLHGGARSEGAPRAARAGAGGAGRAVDPPRALRAVREFE